MVKNSNLSCWVGLSSFFPINYLLLVDCCLVSNVLCVFIVSLLDDAHLIGMGHHGHQLCLLLIVNCAVLQPCFMSSAMI